MFHTLLQSNNNNISTQIMRWLLNKYSKLYKHGMEIVCFQIYVEEF